MDCALESVYIIISMDPCQLPLTFKEVNFRSKDFMNCFSNLFEVTENDINTKAAETQIVSI